MTLVLCNNFYFIIKCKISHFFKKKKNYRKNQKLNISPEAKDLIKMCFT